MYTINVETENGRIVTSSVVLTPTQVEGVRTYLSASSRVANVFITLDDTWFGDIDQAIDDLITNNIK